MSDLNTDDTHVVIDIKLDPNDPTLYLAAASRALNHYRAATRRHGINDLKTFEFVENITADGEYPTVTGARQVMRQMLDNDKRIDPDPNGYDWDWWQETTQDLLESLGHNRHDEEV